MVADSDRKGVYACRLAVSGDQASISSKTPIVPATSSIYVFRSRYESRLKELYQEERFLARKCGSESLRDQVQRMENAMRNVQKEKDRLEKEFKEACERLKVGEQNLMRVTKERDAMHVESGGDIECLRSELSTLKQTHDTTLLELDEREAQITQLRAALKACREQARAEVENRQEFADKLKDQYERALESKDFELRKLHSEKMRETEQKAQLARELNEAKTALNKGDLYLSQASKDWDSSRLDLQKKNAGLQSQLHEMREEREKALLTLEEKDTEISRLRRTLHEMEKQVQVEMHQGAALTAEVKLSCERELERKRIEFDGIQSEKARAIKQSQQLERELAETKRLLLNANLQLQQVTREKDALQDDLEGMKRSLSAELDDVRQGYEKADTILNRKHEEAERLKGEVRALEEKNVELSTKVSELEEGAEKVERLLSTKDNLLRDAIESLEKLDADREDRIQSAARLKEDHQRKLAEKERQLQDMKDLHLKTTGELERKITSITDLKELKERAARSKDLTVRKLDTELQERRKELDDMIAEIAELKRINKKALEDKEAKLSDALALVQESRMEKENLASEIVALKEQHEQALKEKETQLEELQQALEKNIAKLEATTITSLDLREELGRSRQSKDTELKDLRFQLDRARTDLQAGAAAILELQQGYSLEMAAKEDEVAQLLEAAARKEQVLTDLRETLSTRDEEILRLSETLISTTSGIGSMESNLLKLTCSMEKLCLTKGCKDMIEKAGGVGALAEIIESHPVDSEVSKHARKAMAELMLG